MRTPCRHYAGVCKVTQRLQSGSRDGMSLGLLQINELDGFCHRVTWLVFMPGGRFAGRPISVARKAQHSGALPERPIPPHN